MKLIYSLIILASLVLVCQAQTEASDDSFEGQDYAEELRLRGDSLYKTANYKEALALLYESERIFRNNGNYPSLARVLNLMGYNFWFQDENDSAVKYFYNALLSAQKANSEVERGRANLSLGNFYRYEHRNDTALFYFNKALQAVSTAEEEPTRIKAAILSGLGNIYLDRENTKYFSLDSALHYYLRAKTLVEDVPAYRRTFSEVISNIAIVFEEKSSRTKEPNRYLDSAIYYNGISLGIATSQNDRQGIAVTYFNMGNIWFKMGELSNALTSYQRSDSIARVIGNIALRKNSNWNIADVYVEMDGNALITHHINIYDSLNTLLYNRDRADALAELESKYELVASREKQLNDSLRLEKSKRVNTYLISTVLILIILAGVWIYYIEQKKKSLKAISAKNQEIADQKINDLLQQQEISSLQGVLTGQEQERKRIAEDLHDKLGAILGMVKLHFSAVEEKIDTLREDNLKQYQKANELLDLASQEVRNVSHNLVSSVLLKFGLVKALEELKETISSAGKLNLSLFIGDIPESLPEEMERQTYRIIQELLSNILKHADATEATIQLNKTDENEIILMVEDNGKGFDPQLPGGDGIGLTNLKARVGKLNGELHIDSGKGAGTTVSIEIPLGDKIY